MEYIGLESRKQDYDRDKAAGTNFVEDKIQRGDYDRGQRGKIQTCSADASYSTLHAVSVAIAGTKAQTNSKAADSDGIMGDFPGRVLCIRRGFGGREAFRCKLIQRIMERVRDVTKSKPARACSRLANIMLHCPLSGGRRGAHASNLHRRHGRRRGDATQATRATHTKRSRMTSGGAK